MPPSSTSTRNTINLKGLGIYEKIQRSRRQVISNSRESFTRGSLDDDHLIDFDAYYEEGQSDPRRDSQDRILIYDELLEFDELNKMTLPPTNDTMKDTGTGFGINGEELGIIAAVILLWIGAIVLFFNRWGKIRMLEPYQPKFCEEHRPSCPISEASLPPLFPKSFSKLNLLTEENPHFAKCNSRGPINGTTLGGLAMCSYGIPTGVITNTTTTTTPASAARTYRLRQNSVFATSPYSGLSVNRIQKTESRRTMSAIDLPTLVLSEEFFESVRRNSKNFPITHV